MRYLALVFIVALVGCGDTFIYENPGSGFDGGVACTPVELLNGDYHMHLTPQETCGQIQEYYHYNVVIYRNEVSFLTATVPNVDFCEEGDMFRVITGGLNTTGGLTFLIFEGDIDWEALPNVTQTIEGTSYVNGQLDCTATFDLVIEPG